MEGSTWKAGCTAQFLGWTQGGAGLGRGLLNLFLGLLRQGWQGLLEVSSLPRFSSKAHRFF
jgi:hypothetical protein